MTLLLSRAFRHEALLIREQHTVKLILCANTPGTERALCLRRLELACRDDPLGMLNQHTQGNNGRWAGKLAKMTLEVPLYRLWRRFQIRRLNSHQWGLALPERSLTTLYWRGASNNKGLPVGIFPYASPNPTTAVKGTWGDEQLIHSGTISWNNPRIWAENAELSRKFTAPLMHHMAEQCWKSHLKSTVQVFLNRTC